MEHQGLVLWFTGLSGAGKTTISKALESRLSSENYKVERLDGDTIRQSLTRDLGFSPADRDMNIERVSYVAKLLSRNGIIVLCAFITPYRRERKQIREQLSSVYEIYINTPLDICEQRDTKGLYKRARQGEIEHFTGISDPYEEPESPDLIVETMERTVDESVDKIIEFLEQQTFISLSTSGYTKAEEDKIAQRLRSLGYL